MDPSLMLKFPDDYFLMPFEEALNLKDMIHAAHCCIYSTKQFHVTGNYVSKGLISMLVRSDGCLGFPGGKVENGEDIVTGLNRELTEEINLNSKYFFEQENYLFSHRVVSKNLCLHFYAKSVALKEFVEIEKNILDGSEYGHETMGLLRVPLYTMKDDYRGFPAFLCNNFAANSKHQLLNVLLHAKIFDRQELDKMILKSQAKKL